jgi:thiol-disulfide isomerase/thioredoxin
MAFEARESARMSLWGSLFSLVSARPGVSIVSVLVAVFILPKLLFRFPYDAPSVITQSFSTYGDACFEKKRCLVLYVAPWCGACRSDVAFVNELSQQLKSNLNVGLKVIIGSAELPDLQQFAREYRAPALLDAAGEVRQALGVRSFPSYFWVTEEGKITKHPRGSYVLLPYKTQVESYVEAFFADERDLFQ